MTLTNYWWLLIWMFTGGSLLAVLVPRRRELVCGELKERWDTILAVILVIPYIIWAGFRSDAFGERFRESISCRIEMEFPQR